MELRPHADRTPARDKRQDDLPRRQQPLLIARRHRRTVVSRASLDRLVGRNLVIREAERKILVDITFEPPGRIVINRGRFLRNGVEILIRPDRVVLANNGMLFAGQTVHNVPVALAIGPDHPGVSTLIHAPQVPRYRHDRKLVDAWIAEEFDATGRTSGQPITASTGTHIPPFR